jgi:hypothetical protein
MKIWAAFLVGTVACAAVGWLAGDAIGTRINQEILNWVQIFLGLSCRPIILTVFLLRQFLAAVTRGSYRNYCLTRWILIGLMALFGFAQFLLGGHVEVLLIFVAVAALALGAAMPGASDRAAWLGQFE